MLRIRNAETKREIFASSCFGVVIRGAWFVYGMALFVILVKVFSPEIARMFDSEARGFWDDAIAYQAGEKGALDRAELEAKYGQELVAEYLDSEGEWVLVPSDKAQILNLKEGQDDSGGGFDENAWWPDWLTYFASLVYVFPFLLLISYFPAASALRTLQLAVVKLAYVRADRTTVVDTYRSALARRRFHRAIYAYLMTVAWCLAQGLWMVLREGAFSIDLAIQTACGLVATAYVGGLWLFALGLMVDAAFIFLGRNPLAHFWDEAVVMLITLPILIGVFQNSWMTAIVIGLAGLGQVILAKRFYQTSWDSAEPSAETHLEPAHQR